MMKKILFVVMFFSVSSCAQKQTYPVPAWTETVMRDGMSITAMTPCETLTISAHGGLFRSYSWKGGTLTIRMTPRKERWLGSLGLLYSGTERLPEHDGITRIVADEGQMHFKTKDEVLAYMRRFIDPTFCHAYTDDGLFVCMGKLEGAGGTLSVMVWQFYIDGKKPVSLPGSRNDRIIVSHR